MSTEKEKDNARITDTEKLASKLDSVREAGSELVDDKDEDEEEKEGGIQNQRQRQRQSEREDRGDRGDSDNRGDEQEDKDEDEDEDDEYQLLSVRSLDQTDLSMNMSGIGANMGIGASPNKHMKNMTILEDESDVSIQLQNMSYLPVVGNPSPLPHENNDIGEGEGEGEGESEDPSLRMMSLLVDNSSIALELNPPAPALAKYSKYSNTTMGDNTNTAAVETAPYVTPALARGKTYNPTSSQQQQHSQQQQMAYTIEMDDQGSPMLIPLMTSPSFTPSKDRDFPTPMSTAKSPYYNQYQHQHTQIDNNNSNSNLQTSRYWRDRLVRRNMSSVLSSPSLAKLL